MTLAEEPSASGRRRIHSSAEGSAALCASPLPPSFPRVSAAAPIRPSVPGIGIGRPGAGDATSSRTTWTSSHPSSAYAFKKLVYWPTGQRTARYSHTGRQHTDLSSRQRPPSQASVTNARAATVPHPNLVRRGRTRFASSRTAARLRGRRRTLAQERSVAQASFRIAGPTRVPILGPLSPSASRTLVISVRSPELCPSPVETQRAASAPPRSSCQASPAPRRSTDA